MRRGGGGGKCGCCGRPEAGVHRSSLIRQGMLLCDRCLMKLVSRGYYRR